MRGHLPTALTLTLIAALWLHGPIAQFADYHRFADQSSVFGIPHAGDVLSNIGFAIVAAWGWWKLRRRLFAEAYRPGRYGYGLFLASLLLTTMGSSYYHLAPDDARLVWDRLPIALTCAGLLAAVRAESTSAASATTELRDTLLLTLAAGAGVLWWRITALQGTGDLRWYLLFQILPVMLIPLWQTMAGAPRSRRLAVGAAIALYGAAKLAEFYDHQLLDLLHVVSGHTLKHVLAAAAAAFLVPWTETKPK